MNDFDYDITGMTNAVTLRTDPADGWARDHAAYSRLIPDRLMHLRDGDRLRFIDDEPPHVRFAHQGTVTGRFPEPSVTPCQVRGFLRAVLAAGCQLPASGRLQPDDLDPADAAAVARVLKMLEDA